MQAAKVFNSGRNQAERIPGKNRFYSDEAFIDKADNSDMFLPKDSLLDSFDCGITMISDDFPPYGKPDSKQSDRMEL